MKKYLVMALMATLLMAGSAFGVQRNFAAAPNATFVTGAPTTTNNDDSCDISVAPAATLLLPYFEVETASRGVNTLFTITNTSRFPQIAHVVVWTDWSYPVLDFNLFLTGYDVQGISLYDVIVLGQIPPTSSDTAVSPVGRASVASSTANSGTAPLTLTNCTALPGQLPLNLYTAVREALTVGGGSAVASYYGCTSTNRVGSSTGTIAKGYVTVDVANNCSLSLPTPEYFNTEILYDNVLIGDYQQLGPAPVGGTTTGFDGAGNPLVHIRAIPEGGVPGGAATNLPWTFYDRYTTSTNRTVDRRQPLPAIFAARYIQANANVTAQPSPTYATNFKIWREGTTGGLPGCTTSSATTANGAIPVVEFVRFDEAENPFVSSASSQVCSPFCVGSINIVTDEADIINSNNTTTFPPNFTSSSTQVGGWMYMNLNNGGSTSYSTPTDTADFVAGTTTVRRPSQNWVVVEMFGAINANRMSVDFNAAWLGNGCSAAAPVSGIPVTGTSTQTVIGPRPNQTPGNTLTTP